MLGQRCSIASHHIAVAVQLSNATIPWHTPLATSRTPLHHNACVHTRVRPSVCAGSFRETETKQVHLQEISGAVLEKVCQYFYYKLKYANTSSKNIPEFKVPPEMALELLMASNFLDT